MCLTRMCLFVAFICIDKVHKIITILPEELNCKKSQSFEYSSLKKAFESLKGLIEAHNGGSLFLVFFDEVIENHYLFLKESLCSYKVQQLSLEVFC